MGVEGTNEYDFSNYHFGLEYQPASYARERIKEPFKRLEFVK